MADIKELYLDGDFYNLKDVASRNQIAALRAITDNDFVSALTSFMLDTFYPVGSYYETTDTDFDPNESWGGTWVLEAEGKFHLSAGDNYTAGTDGGSSAHIHATKGHTLKVAEMPAHNHGWKMGLTGDIWNVAWQGSNTPPSGSGIVSASRTHQENYGFASAYTSGWEGLTINANHVHDYEGGGNSHSHGNTESSSNIPPYIAVKRWHRTS